MGDLLQSPLSYECQKCVVFATRGISKGIGIKVASIIRNGYHRAPPDCSVPFFYIRRDSFPLMLATFCTVSVVGFPEEIARPTLQRCFDANAQRKALLFL